MLRLLCCRELHAVATAAGDAQVTHFLEDYLLHEQAKDVKKAADLVSRARRCGGLRELQLGRHVVAVVACRKADVCMLGDRLV